MKPVLLLFGPTASGKTALSLDLAERFHGEIISADSMQIYRGMDIGTAKASNAERARIPHHCIDLCDICTPFSVAEYRKAALAAIEDIHARGKLPIVTGGTGLYFDALLYVPSYGQAAGDPALRSALQARVETEGAQALHEQLQAIDPASAARIHANDEKRIIRALEIHFSTGKRPSEVRTRLPNPDFRFHSFFINYESRADLYEACDRRAAQMIEAGLVAEVCLLLEAGLAESPTASQAIGYKELIDHVRGETSLSDALELIQKRTRNYAKRQITWFSKMDSIRLNAADENRFFTAARHTADFLKGAPC